MLNNLSTQVLRALSKALEVELKSREELTPGSYSVDETLSMTVKGKVDKLEDESYTPTIKIAHKAALALLVRNCGITGQAALNALECAMTQALEVDEQSETYIQAIADLERAEEKVKVTLGKLPKAKRTGKTKIVVKVS